MPTTVRKPTRSNKTRNSKKRLIPPENGVTVRMYRTGHGDCFLLAFAGEAADRPAYVLIDCGYKPGSPAFVNTTIADITENIREATGGHLDVAVITHEHQDHVNGITEENFKDITIGETWLAWTECPTDDIANSLRMSFKDRLLGLLAARNRLALDGSQDQVKRLEAFLEFELGGDSEQFDVQAAEVLLEAANTPITSMNKRSMKIVKDRAQQGVKYIRPHEEILRIPGAKAVRAFALGPPRDIQQLRDLDPQGTEEYQRSALAFASLGSNRMKAEDSEIPFVKRYRIALNAMTVGAEESVFFNAHYGIDDAPSYTPDEDRYKASVVPDNPAWRRIDREWQFAAEQLALDMNNYTNNASLVLAFELGENGKVLLFAADAQRGNWVSWAKKDWKDGDKQITARDLLARTVLYKVGHHGSHNATLNGLSTDDSPNLEWMAHGSYGQEFTAMITAVRGWAEKKNGWDHPLASIKNALIKKASGRVFQTDTELSQMAPPDETSPAEWKQFQSRACGERLFFDYTITR